MWTWQSMIIGPAPFDQRYASLRYRFARTPRPTSCPSSARTSSRRSCCDDDRARRRGDFTSPVAIACTRMLPMAVASTGPATTGRWQASAVIWLSSSFWLPPPTMWITSIRRPRMSSRPSSVLRYVSARLSRHVRTKSPRVLGARWPVSSQNCSIFVRHVAGREERLVVRVDHRAEPLDSRRHLRQLGVAVVVALAHPLPAALLHEPQAHDVLQEPDRPADAALVGVVVGERLLVDDRLVQLDAHQRPRARADVAPVARLLAVRRHGGDGAGRVVAGGGDHRDARRRRTPRRRAATTLPDHRAGRHDLRQDARRQAEFARACPSPTPSCAGRTSGWSSRSRTPPCARR